MSAVQLRLAFARAWFRAFRRTRPFWGGVWLLAGGLWVLYFSLADVQLVVSSGFVGIGAWVVSGGMALCGALSIAAPSQRFTLGFFGTLLSIVSLPASNFGGFLLGMTFGVVGGTMVMAWGPKRSRESVAVA